MRNWRSVWDVNPLLITITVPVAGRWDFTSLILRGHRPVIQCTAAPERRQRLGLATPHFDPAIGRQGAQITPSVLCTSRTGELFGYLKVEIVSAGDKSDPLDIGHPLFSATSFNSYPPTSTANNFLIN
jgi:hypothetical protein